MAQKPAGRVPADPRPGPRPTTSDDSWRPVRPQGRRRVVAAIVALAMLLTVLGGTAVTIMTAFPASAHDSLVSSDPKDGAELDEPTGTITLTYSADILPDGTMVEVTTPDGDVTADVTVDGKDVVADLGEQTSGGEYAVRWRVVSSDGHPIEGELDYTVADQPEAAESPGSSPEAGPAASPEASTGAGPAPSQEAAEPAESPSAVALDASADGDSDGSGALPWVYGAAVVAAIGVALALVVRARRRPQDPQGAPGQEGPQD
ncbi:copper resistance protein CopC [Isoptericola jiangsuensis]|uniref:copper resistance CopC family protein n=1 Tax=Isoptericola jiangsuensis TaxID=548579 RepID=UPI003AAB179C